MADELHDSVESPRRRPGRSASKAPTMPERTISVEQASMSIVSVGADRACLVHRWTSIVCQPSLVMLARFGGACPKTDTSSPYTLLSPYASTKRRAVENDDDEVHPTARTRRQHPSPHAKDDNTSFTHAMVKGNAQLSFCNSSEGGSLSPQFP